MSHTLSEEEVSYQLLSKPEPKSLTGYRKLTAFCRSAAAQSWKYTWVDTCCIDKTSSAEVSEAINSIWRWYKKFAIWFAHLDDLVRTLQELLASTKIVFYDPKWKMIRGRDTLSFDISAATEISRLHLRHPRQASVAAKVSWMSKRRTTRSEDIAYSFLGSFRSIHAFDLRRSFECLRSAHPTTRASLPGRITVSSRAACSRFLSLHLQVLAILLRFNIVASVRLHTQSPFWFGDRGV